MVPDELLAADAAFMGACYPSIVTVLLHGPVSREPAPVTLAVPVCR
jgi:hypothetical protein